MNDTTKHGLHKLSTTTLVIAALGVVFFWRITGRSGFMQTPNVPRLLRQCSNHDLEVDPEKSTFFLGREIIIPSKAPGMARWREHLFSLASKLAQQPATYFQIPVGRVIELGQQVEI